MKYNFPIATAIIAITAMAACSNNPEGAFNDAEKHTQDSLDSLSNEAMFDDLYQDTTAKDTQPAKPGDVTTETVPSTPPNSTPFQAHTNK
jgi:hypothetical protein